MAASRHVGSSLIWAPLSQTLLMPVLLVNDVPVGDGGGGEGGGDGGGKGGGGGFGVGATNQELNCAGGRAAKRAPPGTP